MGGSGGSVGGPLERACALCGRAAWEDVGVLSLGGELPAGAEEAMEGPFCSAGAFVRPGGGKRLAGAPCPVAGMEQVGRRGRKKLLAVLSASAGRVFSRRVGGMTCGLDPAGGGVRAAG
jgi:hypothetical protein